MRRLTLPGAAPRAVTVLSLLLSLLTVACTEDGDVPQGSCRVQSDCALGERCESGTCTAAACDDAENPCAFGERCASDGRCETDPDAAAAGVVLEPLGMVRVTTRGSEEVLVDVPEGAESFAVVVDGGAARLALAHTITSPTGKVVFSWPDEIATNRTDATDGVYTLLVPTTPEVEVTPGRWRLSFLTNEGAFDGQATAVVKTSPNTLGTLDLNLHFVGLGDGLDAAQARSSAAFQELLAGVERRWADAGLTIGEVSYHDITGTDADRFRVVDSVSAHGDELFELFALSAGHSNRALDLFFVADIATRDGFSLLGLAGGIPGPPLLHGTQRSGVVVNMSDWLAAAGDPAALAAAVTTVELVIAHETGHYLGLYHTTERNGQALDPNGVSGVDPLSDTPICPDSADASGNRILSADECGTAGGGDNLMFWSPHPQARTLTPQQTLVLRKNPLVR